MARDNRPDRIGAGLSRAQLTNGFIEALRPCLCNAVWALCLRPLPIDVLPARSFFPFTHRRAEGHTLQCAPTAVGEVPGVGERKLYLKRKLPAEGEGERERGRGRGKEREGYRASTSTSVFDGEERTR